MQPINGTTTASAQLPSTIGQAPGAQPVDKLANKETFLKLLVAQIKNQDPLQPTDGVQFLSQLAQFSQLEQLIGIRTELGQARAQPTGTANDSGQNPTPPVPAPSPAT